MIRLSNETKCFLSVNFNFIGIDKFWLLNVCVAQELLCSSTRCSTFSMEIPVYFEGHLDSRVIVDDLNLNGPNALPSLHYPMKIRVRWPGFYKGLRAEPAKEICGCET
jgi:hypothetical protein